MLPVYSYTNIGKSFNIALLLLLLLLLLL